MELKWPLQNPLFTRETIFLFCKELQKKKTKKKNFV